MIAFAVGVCLLNGGILIILIYITVSPGAFSCQIQEPQTEQYSFRFFLDFPEGAIRNDVVLPAERIYFVSKNCCIASYINGCG